MAKKHISFWIEEKDLKECDANVITSNCNSYLHNKNNEDYINQNLKDSLAGMMKRFEKRNARLMFKISVEVAKIFWLLVKELEIDLRDADTLHYSCVEEVKKINGAIEYPFIKDDKKDDDELFFD